MTRLRRTLGILLILITCVGCDQATKSVAKTYLPRGETLTFAADTFRLQYAENHGAFLSLGRSLPEQWRSLIFTIGVAVIMLGLLGYLLLATNLHPTQILALALVCGGGLSNLLDRIVYGGYVVDFMNVGIGGLRTGIFNVADMAITGGVIMLFFSSTQEPEPTPAEQAAESVKYDHTNSADL